MIKSHKVGIEGTYIYVSKCQSLSRVRLFVTLWTAAHQAPLSMRFSRQGYWSRLPFPSPGDLLDPGNEPRSPALQADTLPSEPPGKPHINIIKTKFHKPAAKIILNGEKLKEFPLRSGKRQLLPLLFNVVLEVLATAVREEK